MSIPSRTFFQARHKVYVSHLKLSLTATHCRTFPVHAWQSCLIHCSSGVQAANVFLEAPLQQLLAEAEQRKPAAGFRIADFGQSRYLMPDQKTLDVDQDR